MKLSKILLVEDSQEIADIVIALLEYEGHVVIHKVLGEEGMKALQSERFDGVILDYMLPDTDGLTFCKTVRRAGSQLPIILTSSYLEKISPEQMAEAGVTIAIQKPLSQNLRQVVSKYILTRSAEAESKKAQEHKGFMARVLGG